MKTYTRCCDRAATGSLKRNLNNGNTLAQKKKSIFLSDGLLTERSVPNKSFKSINHKRFDQFKFLF